jgi:4-amino-4-deoxy-L-arabinose transferase-like glycosyltransferase
VSAMTVRLQVGGQSIPQRRARSLTGATGAAFFVAGGVGAFLLMAHDAQLRFGVPAGAVCIAACAWGLLELLGKFDPPDASPSPVSTGLQRLAGPAVAAAVASLSVVLSLWAAVHGAVPQLLAGGLLTSSFIGCAASLFVLAARLGPLRLDESGQPRTLLRRHGFWLLAAMALLYLPTLGIGSLTDPWETHYGEVAREVLARDDWISTWWSWEGFFYSKPVLGIWIQSIAMATLGVQVQPDRMLLAANGGLEHPEWAVRAPFALFAMAGTYLLYKGAARWFGRPAALLGALVLATSPSWFFLAHQSMTDMPFVASVAGAMGLVLVAAREDDATQVRTYEVAFGRHAVRLTLRHVVLGAILVVALPQILYLASRNVELVLHADGPHGFRLHADEVLVGSGLGNCNQPGDPACTSHAPAASLEPWMQALGWSGLLAGILALCRRERRTKRLVYVAAWALAGVATMAKGPAGVAIPAACVGTWIAMTRRWSEIPRAAVGAGLLVVVLLVGPWSVAMVVRHGSAFTDELFFHDIYNRAFEHVHDTNAGADTGFAYYLGQLGYGLFPWIALVPLGLMSCFGRDGGPVASRSGSRLDVANDGALLLLAWFGVVFALFTAMGTKFHHYIAPAVPPLAMLVGVALEGCFRRRRRPATARASHRGMMLAAACAGGALLVGLVTRDLVEGQARLMQLFTYRYDRPWPASLDWSTPLTIAGATASLLAAALVVPRARRVTAGAWVALALAWAAWGLDVYLPGASPHWGQRAVMEAYYRQRRGPEEPIVAYRLNWKGENFYTGNRIPQFGTPTVPPNTPAFRDWVRDQKGRGASVMFFVTEHSGVAGLRSELGQKSVREVTTRLDSNQFVLVRADL